MKNPSKYFQPYAGCGFQVANLKIWKVPDNHLSGAPTGRNLKALETLNLPLFLFAFTLLCVFGIIDVLSWF
jgi:hypothetical protein